MAKKKSTKKSHHPISIVLEGRVFIDDGEHQEDIDPETVLQVLVHTIERALEDKLIK